MINRMTSLEMLDDAFSLLLAQGAHLGQVLQQALFHPIKETTRCYLLYMNYQESLLSWNAHDA